MKIDTPVIIWDLDGTLINSFDIYTKTMAKILPEFGVLVPDVEKMRQHFFGKFSDCIKNSCNVDDEQAEQIIKRFCEAEAPRYAEPQEHFYEDAISLVLLAADSGKKQIVVTNRDHSDNETSPRSIIAKSSIKPHIQHIVCGNDLEHRKPDPRVIEHILADLKIEPNQITVIGDQHVDAQLAINLGARAILVERGDKIANLHLLADGWKKHVTIVATLNDVII